MTEQILAATRAYMDFVLSTERQTEDPLFRDKTLMRHLDTLASLMHDVVVPTETIEDELEATDIDFRDVYKRIDANFPEYGHYAVVNPVESVDAPAPMVGDAIDDLADIYRDLSEFIWRYEHSSPYDALFHLDLTYTSHWGGHLRELQLYLHRFVYG